MSRCKRSNGERGIRTLGTKTWHNGFRIRLLRPLGHLSMRHQADIVAKRIRTSDLQIRNLMLYPAELWLQVYFNEGRQKKRRGGDSNPRYRYQYNSLAGSPIQPLSHLSKEQVKYITVLNCKILGERGIRTPGDSRLNGFQDRLLRPLGHLSNQDSHYSDTIIFCQVNHPIYR